jgi:hypothetical protein
MRTLIISMMVAALVIGSVWVVTPTIQAQETQDLELQACALPGIVKCGLMTRLACQNAGGKVVEKCDDAVRIK